MQESPRLDVLNLGATHMTRPATIRDRIATHTGRALQALSGVRMVGTAATMGYCAVHLATTHRFSPMMFAGAVMFGAVVAVTVTLLSGCLSGSRPS